MNLYFLRHAKAYPRSKEFTPDSKRPLTPDGEKEMRKVARGMDALELEFDVILTSPYVRALKTAEIAAKVVHSKKFELTDNLASDAKPEQLVEEINDRFSRADGIMLVGHEPYMSSLMSRLLTGSIDLKIDFKKAGLAKLSIEQLRFGQCASLEWVLTPRQLVLIGKA